MAYKKINTKRNRIEIYFDSKPIVEIRDYMKRQGWRWHSTDHCWFNFDSEKNRLGADKICNISNRTVTKEKPKTGNGTKNISLQQEESGKKADLYNNQKKGHTYLKNEKVTMSRTCPLKENDVVFYEEKGKLYFSTVRKTVERTGNLSVQYKKNPLDEKYIVKSVDRKKLVKIENCRKYTKEIIKVGKWAAFETEEHAIQLCKIIDRKNNRYSLRYYLCDSVGRIKAYENHNVAIDRVISKEIFSLIDINFYHLMPGEDVEFILKDEILTGRVKEVKYDDEFITVEYGENSYLQPSQLYLAKILVTDIFKRIESSQLQRSDFLSKLNEEEIKFNKDIKQRIQERLDNFSAETCIADEHSLFPHQKAGLMLSERYNKFAFFYDTGTGKTVMALDVIAQKQKKGATFLIIAPKSIIKTAWMDDAKTFFPSLRILPLYKGFTSDKAKKLLKTWNHIDELNDLSSVARSYLSFLAVVFGYENVDNLSYYDNLSVHDINHLLQKNARHYIVNSEYFIQNYEDIMQQYNINAIVMDESAVLKNYDSKTANVMRKIAPQLEWCYLLSGKPAPNSEVEYFSQMKIVSPKVFSMSYDKFKKKFCMTSGFKTFINPNYKDLFAGMISTRSLIISKTDCLNLPETKNQVRLVELPENIMNKYNELYYDCMTILKGMDNSMLSYSATSRLAVLMKLRQVSSGFFIETGDNKNDKVILEIHYEKLKELRSVLSEIPGEQVIVWCQFQYEVELLEKELSKIGRTVTAYGKSIDLEKNIDMFKRGEAQFIVAHPKTLKYGVTFTNCQHVIYYSFSYSAEDYDQSHDRNYRLGQKKDCIYYFIQCEDTIDEIMYDKVVKKLTNAEFFERLIKDASKHGIDYSRLKPATDEEIKLKQKEKIDSQVIMDISTDINDGFFSLNERESTPKTVGINEQIYINKLKNIFAKDNALYDELKTILSQLNSSEEWIIDIIVSTYQVLCNTPATIKAILMARYGLSNGVVIEDMGKIFQEICKGNMSIYNEISDLSGSGVADIFTMKKLLSDGINVFKNEIALLQFKPVVEKYYKS